MLKYFRYAKYVIRHKWYVGIAGIACGVSWWRILKHDISKFFPSELFPYAKFFYGYESKKDPNRDGPKSILAPMKVHDAFDVAWLKHKNRNDHHFEHWIILGDNGLAGALKMPEQAWRELCADFLGMSYTLHGNWDAMKYYSENYENIILHPQTRFLVERLLKSAGSELERNRTK